MQALRYAMQFNALSCAGFGMTLLLFGHSVADFVGSPPAVGLTVLGGLLLLNAAHLIIAAGREKLNPGEVIYFVAGDTAWVLGTFLLLGLGWVATTAGISAALAVGAMVGGFAVIQARLLWTQHRWPHAPAGE